MPRVVRAVVLVAGLREARLDLWAIVLDRSLASSRADVGFAVALVGDFEVVEVATEAGLFDELVLVAWMFDGLLVTVFDAGFSEGSAGVEAVAGTGPGPCPGADVVGSSCFAGEDPTDDVLTTRDAGCSLTLLFSSRFRAAVPCWIPLTVWSMILVWPLSLWPPGVGEITFCRRASTSSWLILGPNIPGLSLRPLVFRNGEPGFDWMAPSTVTKLARTRDSGRVVEDPGVSAGTGVLPREGGEVMGLSPFSNLASKLRTPGWALLSDIVVVKQSGGASWRN